MMTNLLHGAHVANKLFSTIARLRLLLVMFLTLTVTTNAWGADVTVTWTASSGALGSNIGSGTIKTGTFSWDYTRTLKSGSTYTGWSSNCIQLGKNGGVENITFTTSAIPGTIKKVSIECASYQGKHNVAITVGGKSYLSSTATSSWTTVSAQSGSGTSSGTIQISLTGGTRALYIKSISVTYEENSGSGGEIPEPDEPSEDACGWVEADISEITSTDNVVITMSKGDNVWALANNNGTGSAPAALLITIANGEITPAEDDFNYNGYSLDHYTWNISTNSDELTFYPKGSISTWLYCTGTNNGVRVGTNANKTFTIDASSGYLKHTSTSRYVGVYTTNPDWRCYENTTGNIAGQTLKFYKYVECTTEPTVFTVTFDANGGSGSMEPQTFTVDVSQDLSENQFTRNYYTFKGWTIDKEGSSTLYNNMQTFTVDRDVTLYAQWTPIKYTITLDANQPSPVSSLATHADGLTLPDATPCDYAEQNGWTFAGWKEDFKQTETTVRPALYTGKYYPTRNVTLHAVYAKTGTAQGAAGEFILSLEYGSTTYYVGQTFDNSKLSAETDQNNAARFTIEDNYLHYEGGYISHVATTSSPNITKQADKANAQAWTITEVDNTVIFTSTADNTRGLGFNYNEGSPRFAAYKLNEKDGETIKYPSTFTKTSVSGGDVQVTTYNSNPSCEAPVDPKWQPATINFEGIIQVECGSKTLLNAADPNGPATITFNGYDLQNSVTVTASDGFFVSTDKVNDAGYKSEITINPHKEGQNIGKLQNVYVIAQAPAQSGDFSGTITLTGADITGGSQVINVTADVTCTTYTITWSVDGDTELIAPTTFYAGGKWELPEDPTYECNGREFVGWTNTEIVQPQDNAPNVLYKEQGEFPTIESNIKFYAVFAKKGTDDGSGNSGDTKTVTLPRPSKAANGYQVGTTVDSEGNTWSYYATLNNQSGTLCYGLNSDLNNYHISSPIFGGTIKSISFKAHNGSSSANRKFLFCSSNTTAQPTTGDLAEVTIPKSESFSQIYTADLSQLGVNQFHIYVAAALSITDIAVTYTTGSSTSSTTYTSYTTSCADVKAIRIVEPTTKTFNEGDKFVFDGKVWAINDDGTETEVTGSPLVRFDYDMYEVGPQTVTVSYLGFTATYEITINAVDKWQITWNVSGATNTGLGPKEVAKGTAIGKLPQPTAIPAGCTGKEFRGWTESNTVNSDGSSIEWITEETVPTANTTYYAVFATNSGEGSGDGNYVKLTDTPTNLSGEYLIVYEDAENNYDGAKAFDGGLATLDAASNTISVTINGNTIESTDDTDAAKFTIAPYNGGYSIKSASNKYIGRNTDANELDESTSTSYTNTITITDGNANIIGSGGAYLRYNKASGDTRFRYYKSSTYTGQQPIALYKKSNSYASYTNYTTGCHDVTITYYGFTGGYTTNCGGSDLNVITTRVNSSHTIPNCGNITDPTDLGRTFLNLWKDQNGKVHQPGETFIVTQDITLYAQWALNTSENTTLPTDVEDLATTDIVVTGGKTLTIPEGKTITINSLTLKGGIQEDNKSYAMPIVKIPDNATLVRKDNKINLDLKINNQNFYPFAVPFEVANTAANINYINTTLKEYVNAYNGYGKFYVIREYNGALRAENGANKDENWVHVGRSNNEKLLPGKGYIISAVPAAGTDTVTIRITMTVDNAWLADGEQESITVKEQTTTRNQVAVTAYTGTAATNDPCNAGWNFVANPYLTNFAGASMKDDNDKNLDYIEGEIIVNNGHFEHDGTKIPYVTIPASDFGWYDQYRVSDVKLSPMWSFFVQIGTDGTMNFTTAGRQQAPAHLAARAAEQPIKMDVDITLSDDNHSDQTGLIICDRFSDAYEIGHDLEKMFGSAYNLSVYTLMADNTPLAFQALAIQNSMQVIPVGYRTPAQGEYTFALNEATSDIELLNEQYEQLILVDYETGALTNMLNNEYTFYSDRTQSNNRFALYAVPRQNTTTDLPNAIGNEEVKKVIYNDHFYILRDGKVFNGAGQIVK